MAGLVTLTREETDGNVSGGWEEEGNKQTNTHTDTHNPQKTNQGQIQPWRLPYMVGMLLKGVLKGVKGDFFVVVLKLNHFPTLLKSPRPNNMS